MKLMVKPHGTKIGAMKEVKRQDGKIFLITGSTNSMGQEAALELTRLGARVIIASDDQDKGLRAIKSIADQVPDADIGFETLNLADLESIRIFSFRMRSMLPYLDGLILNASISGVAHRTESEDGFELILATNYLGHVALTALLFPLLADRADSRIIGVGSPVHQEGRIHFEDLQMKRSYRASKAYAQSKLALMLFTFELQRKIEEKGLLVKSLSVDPTTSLLKRFSLKKNYQSASKALVHAATYREVKGGAYYGPEGISELTIQASNMTVAKRLWHEALRLVGVEFDFGDQGLSRHH